MTDSEYKDIRTQLLAKLFAYLFKHADNDVVRRVVQAIDGEGESAKTYTGAYYTINDVFPDEHDPAIRNWKSYFPAAQMAADVLRKSRDYFISTCDEQDMAKAICASLHKERQA